MVIKNLNSPGPSGNIKPIPIHQVIFPSASAIIKVTISTQNDGELDITDLISTADFHVGVTNTVGDFRLKFYDPEQTYSEKINNFDDVYVYADYGSEATTKRFRFKIESKGYYGFATQLSGKGIGMILSEKSIIYQTLDNDENLIYKNKSDVLQEIIEDNFPEITDFSQIESDTTQIQKSYFEVPFMDVIEDLCGDTKYFYLDHDLVPHYFTKGSRVNTTEAVTSDNLITLNENSNNAEEVYSRVRVYGKSEGGIPVLHTKDIGTTNTGGINKDYQINNTSVVSTDQAELLSESTASNLTNPTQIGDLVTLLLPSLLPGESFFIAIPEEQINPQYYNVKEFSFSIDNEGDFAYKTSFIIEKKRVNQPRLFKDVMRTQKSITENDNPNDLDYSRIITFKEDIGNNDNTEISEDYLKVKAGQSTGTWISPIYSIDDDISEIEVRWFGDQLVQDYQSTSSQLWVSTNGGATWKYLLFTGKSTIPVGRDLRVKVVLNSSDARVKRIGIYYSF